MTDADPHADTLARARAVAPTAPQEAWALCWDVLGRDPAHLGAHHLLEDLGAPDRFSAWMRVNCRIDPRDEIFRFFATHYLARNPIREYLADGWRTLSQLMVLLEDCDRPLRRVASVLEFAAGFGRFTRHLATVLPGRVTASDVQPGSVDFLREQFGVAGFYSRVDPEGITYPQRYEVVFVLSLFSHLPPADWPRWLASLRRAVAPGGLLIFSVHSEANAAERGAQYDAAGTWFIPASESPSLPGQVYGTTCTTRAFTERTVAEVCGAPPLHYREAAFWAGQDAVVCRLD